MGLDLSTNKKGLLCLVSGIVLFFNDINLERFLLEPLSASFLNVKLFEKLGIALIVSGLVIIFDKLPHISLWKKISEVSQQIKNGFNVIKSANEVGITGIIMRRGTSIQTKLYEDKIIKVIETEFLNPDGEILILCVAAKEFFSKEDSNIGGIFYKYIENMENKCKLKVLLLCPESEGAKYREKLEPQHALLAHMNTSITNLSNLKTLFNFNEIIHGDYDKLETVLKQYFEYDLDRKNISIVNNNHIEFGVNKGESNLIFDGSNTVNLRINKKNYDLIAESVNGRLDVCNPKVEFKLYDFLPPVLLIVTHEFVFIETYPMFEVKNKNESLGGRCPMLLIKRKTFKGEETETYRRWKGHFEFIWKKSSHNYRENCLSPNSFMTNHLNLPKSK